uniref:Putative secreted peptide n=1 Tax=Anopheles braziliensis TaxID=58242 RepID=A0A2M3ZS67_9DIPT
MSTVAHLLYLLLQARQLILVHLLLDLEVLTVGILIFRSLVRCFQALIAVVIVGKLVVSLYPDRRLLPFGPNIARPF